MRKEVNVVNRVLELGGVRNSEDFEVCGGCVCKFVLLRVEMRVE